MTNEKGKYKVIIVGAGPAGSTAAYCLGKFNIKTLLLDKEEFPRSKLCGGLLTLKTINILQDIYQNDIKKLTKQKIINFKSNYYKIYYKEKKLLSGFSKIPFCFVRRKCFDNFLLNKIDTDSSVTIKKGVEVVKINLEQNFVQTSAGDVYNFDFLIGADGVNSIVRKELIKKKFLKSNNWLNDLALGLEIFVNRKKIKSKINCPLIFLGLVKWGYAWVFPNKDEVLIGLGGLLRKNKNFLVEFRTILDFLNIKDYNLKKINGHLIPYGNILKKPVYKNVLLVGDAAGTVDPITGEGIFYAILSGKLASQSIVKNPNNTKKIQSLYLSLYKDNIYTQLNKAKKIRALIFTYFVKLPKFLLKNTIQSFNSKLTEIVHKIKPYTCLINK